MTRKEKKEELIGLFSTGAIFIGDLIDECFEWAFANSTPSFPLEDEIAMLKELDLNSTYIVGDVFYYSKAHKDLTANDLILYSFEKIRDVMIDGLIKKSERRRKRGNHGKS